MARRTGEVSITEAAQILGVHHSTVRRWAHAALTGSVSPLLSVRTDVTGHLWLRSEEIEGLRNRSRTVGEPFRGGGS